MVKRYFQLHLGGYDGKPPFDVTICTAKTVKDLYDTIPLAINGKVISQHEGALVWCVEEFYLGDARLTIETIEV